MDIIYPTTTLLTTLSLSARPLSVAAGGRHQAPGHSDAGQGAGLHGPHRGLRVRQPAAAAAGDAAHVAEEQTHRR